MKTVIKRIASCLIFSVLLVALLLRANEVVINKEINRYYYLEDFVASANESYAIQAYGSCHTYTSFDAPYISETFGVNAYVLANPAEIIPVTYLRMAERFKTDAPQVAVVDIWGLNAYETYMSAEELFDKYMAVNLELLPVSAEKAEVIDDYESLDMIQDNFAISKYKDRFLEMEITELDYNYSFDLVALGDDIHPDGYINFIMKEIEVRKNNNGYSRFDPSKDTMVIPDFPERQAKVEDSEKIPYEEDMLKYLEKIIDLCDEYGVELIFYRTPYISTENELRKTNWFADYCAERDIPFYNLEKEIEFDFYTDFQDYCHLNELGAHKATEFLADKIRPLLG